MGNGGFCPEFIEKKPEKEYCKSSKQILGNNSGYCIVESHRRIYDRTSHLPESIAAEYKDCFFLLLTDMSEVLQTDKPVRMNSRLFLLIAMGMMSAFGPFVTDFYLPGLPALAAWFGTTTSWVQLSLTTSMMGLGWRSADHRPCQRQIWQKRDVAHLDGTIHCFDGCLPFFMEY